MRSLTAMLLCIVASSSAATTTVAIQAEDAIYIGSDSLLNELGGVHRRGCKIGANNDVVWGASGILEFPTAHFNVLSIAASAMSQPGGIDVEIAKFERDAVPPLTEILNGLKFGDPTLWVRANYENASPLEIVFGAIENGTPHLYGQSYIVETDAITGRVSLGVQSATRMRYAILGRGEAIKTLAQANEESIIQSPTISIQNLIDLEIRASPNDVGLPIALLRLDKNGMHWINIGMCGTSQQQREQKNAP